MAKKFVDLAVITIAGVTSFVDVAGVPKDATVNYIYTETTPTTPQETTADLMTINLYYIADRNDAGIYTGGEWEYMAIASVVSDVSEIEGGGSGDCYAVIKETESIIGTWVINETITPFSTNIDTLNIIGTVGISDVTDNTFETVYYAYNGTIADVGIQLLLGDDHNVIYYLDDNHNPKLTGSIGYIENTGVVYKSSFNPTVKNRTITITGGADITNDTFVIWLKANATKLMAFI